MSALEELDLEVWLLALRQTTEVCVIGKEDEAPPGWFTEDGVCYFRAGSDEDFARTREIAQASFDGAQAFYWRLVYGLLFESPAECEEFARRWRTARIGDLGFPDLEQAMRAYRPLAIEEAAPWELGDDEKTFEWLERGFEARDTWLLLIPIALDDALRADPRYQDLLRRTGLPER